jgi:SAM-dependent methyltransferase
MPAMTLQRLTWAFARQFARPYRPLGQVAAGIMRRGNAPINLWIVELMELKSDSRILEVGFGPGIALAELLHQTPKGFVAGIDPSASMANQARRRHRKAIASGHLQIHCGDASSIPFEGQTFNWVSGTHVLYFWADPVATILELQRVLRLGGSLALGFQERAHMPATTADGLSAAGAKLVDAGEVEELTRKAGFGSVRLETKPGVGGPAGFCVIATK